MNVQNKISVTVEVTVNAPIDKVWKYWNEPEHIKQWYQASEDWHAPYAENDFRVGGKFKVTMAAKDDSFSFDFEGNYLHIKPHSIIKYSLGDGRQVKIVFTGEGEKTTITETFDAEDQNPVDMQRGGWQAILDNFKKYAESE